MRGWGGVGGGYTEMGGGPGPSYNAARQNLPEGIHGVFLLAEGWAEVSLSADRKSGIPHGRDKTPPVNQQGAWAPSTQQATDRATPQVDIPQPCDLEQLRTGCSGTVALFG